MIQETYERFEEHGIFFKKSCKNVQLVNLGTASKNVKRNTKSPEDGKEEYKVPVYLRQRRITFIRPTINSSKIMKKDYRYHQSKERGWENSIVTKRQKKQCVNYTQTGLTRFGKDGRICRKLFSPGGNGASIKQTFYKPFPASLINSFKKLWEGTLIK